MRRRLLGSRGRRRRQRGARRRRDPGQGWGGALAIDTASQSADIINTTFQGNRASVTGGAISVNGGRPLALHHVTIADNTTIDVYGGAIGGNPSGVQIDRSIIARNDAPACDASEAIMPTSMGSNLGSPTDDTSCQLSAPTDRLVADALLSSTLAGGDNGIPVLLPQAGSPAIGAVADGCATTDATGRARSAPCAIGAAEPLPGAPAPGAGSGGDGGTGGGTGGGDTGGGTGGGGTDPGTVPATAGNVPTPPVVTALIAPRLTLPARVTVNAARRRASFVLACPASAASCIVTPSLERRRTVRGKTTTTRLTTRAKAVTLAAGKRRQVTVTLSADGRKALARRSRLAATLRLRVADPRGARREQFGPVSLRVARR